MSAYFYPLLQTPKEQHIFKQGSSFRNVMNMSWNRILPVITQNPQKTSFGWVDVTQTDNRRMYYRLCMIKYLLFTISPNNTFKYKLKDLIAAYPTIDIKAMGFPENWDNEPVWR